MVKDDTIRKNIRSGEVEDSPSPPSHLSEEDVAFESRMIGTEINNRFKILNVLGHGGFGSVFLAHQKSVDRNVAIKILRPSWSHRPQVAQRFLIEAKATSQLQSPHTVTVFDFGTTEDNLLYIAMEYLEGQTLHDRLNQSPPLNMLEALKVVGQIAESLAEAHEQGIVHRDLKPENVLLLNRNDSKLFVKVLDFGIARSKELSDQLNLTQTGQFSGTPAYMSPEVIRSKSIAPTADVYSMGILLYQLLTGKCPFSGDNPFDVLTQHVSVKPKPSRQLNSKIPVRLDIFVQRCLAKRTGKRPADARVFLKELRNIERTEMEKLKEVFPPTVMGLKASSSAATVAVVEETQEAIRISLRNLRWVRLWLHANPRLATLVTTLIALIVMMSSLFLETLGPHSQWQTHEAGAQTYFPSQGTWEEHDLSTEADVLSDDAVELDNSTGTTNRYFDREERNSIVVPSRDSAPMNEAILNDGLKEAAEPEFVPSPADLEKVEGHASPSDSSELKPTSSSIQSRTSKSLRKNRANRKAGVRATEGKKVDRASILLGDSPMDSQPKRPMDKVDAFLD